MNERIPVLQASLNPPLQINPDILNQLLQHDSDWQAVYCLTEELIKVYAEQNMKGMAYLGKRNLQSAISHWRYELRGCVKELKRLGNMVQFLEQHQTLESLAQFAAKFSGVDPSYGLHYDKGHKVYEPENPAAWDREAKTSTLQVCGWCKFGNAFLCRGYCHLTCKCNLMTEESRANTGYLRFDAPCPFRQLVADDAKYIAERLNELRVSMEHLQERKREYLKKIAILSELRDTAEDKPLFPCCGFHVRYDEGAQVIVLAADPEKQDPETGIMPLYRGTVIPSKYRQRGEPFNRPKFIYRDYNSYMAHICAGVQMSNYPAILLEADAGANGPWYAVGSSFSMLETDFDYLCKHPGYAGLWLYSLSVQRFPDEDWVRKTWALAFARGGIA